jgi:hypothetical protein
MFEVLNRDVASFRIVRVASTRSRVLFSFALDILTTDAIFIEVSLSLRFTCDLFILDTSSSDVST